MIRPVVDVVVDLVVGFSVETAEAVARTVEELRAAATLISRGEGANVETAETAARAMPAMDSQQTQQMASHRRRQLLPVHHLLRHALYQSDCSRPQVRRG